jgi:hypothetical protein
MEARLLQAQSMGFSRVFVASKRFKQRRQQDMDILECPTLKQALELGLTAAIPKRQRNNTSRSTSTKLSQRAFQLNEMHIVLLCTLRQLPLSFKYGLCPETAEALASYGILLCDNLDKLGSCFRMAHLSKVLLEYYITESKDKRKARSKMSRVLFTTTVYIDPWSSPIPIILNQLQLAHSEGMESGDIESAHRAWGASYMHACEGGFPLNYVLQDATNLE